MKRKILVIFVLLILSAFLLKASDDYKIGPKDLIEISVFQLPELNTQARVSQSGYITIPLLGKIKVEGLTAGELENLLAEKLSKKYLQNPQVTIFIKEYVSRRAYIIGAVNKPGPYEIIGKTSLLKIIATAGGFSEFVGGKEITIIREDKKISVKFEDLIDNYKPEENIEILPNDLIIVPQQRVKYIYVIGQVVKPGLIGVSKTGDITLLEAIATAGGFTDKASKSNVILHRKINGKIKIYKFNVKDIIYGKDKDFLVKEGDIIYVKESVL